MKKPALFLLIAFVISCSNEKDLTESENQAAIFTNDSQGDSAIPESKHINTIFLNSKKLTLDELDFYYRKDIETTKPAYDAPLKNMWFMILNERLVDSDNIKLKKFYLNEQIKTKENLATFNGFYDLLLSEKSMKGLDKLEIATAFSKKNREFVEKEWTDPELKKHKLGDLLYATRIFHIMNSSVKVKSR